MGNTIIAIILAIILVTSVTVSAYARPQEVISNSVYIYIWEVSKEFDISPFLLASLVYQESRFIITDNLTQITNKKWFYEGLEYCESNDISNPYVNIRCCGYYLHKWAQEYDGEPALWLMMWNEGYENALRHYNPQKPSRYAREILNRAYEWEQDFESEVD